MGIFQLWSSREADDDMARKAKLLDRAKVEGWVRQLKAAFDDAQAFRLLQDQLIADKSISSGEAAEIALLVAGKKVKSKKEAVTALGQERLRLAHAKAKSESARKTKTW